MAGGDEVRRRSHLTRSTAAEAYPYRACVICGLVQDGALDVCHLDQNAANDDPDNLAYMCKTHHRMFDMGLYPVEAVRLLRDHWQKTRGVPDHSIYMKDAGSKAGRTLRRKAAARRAVQTRQKLSSGG